MAYFAGGQSSVALAGGADYAGAYRVTPGFFEALGVRVAIGRLLSDEEQKPEGPLAVVITDVLAAAIQRRGQRDRRADQVRRSHLHHRSTSSPVPASPIR